MKYTFEISKELADKTYELVEISKSTGKVKRGTNEVTKVIERGVAKLIIIAQDVSPPEVVMHMPALCDDKEIPFTFVPKREELGTASGVSVPTASVGIVDAGEGKNLLQEIVNDVKKLRGSKDEKGKSGKGKSEGES